MTAAEPFERVTAGRPGVRGFVHRPAVARDGLVLTHGAGSDCSAPLLVALAAAFAAAGVAVMRCDLPYRQARPKGPPSPSGAARDRDGLCEAARAMRAIAPGRVFLGGSSYGGRQASLLLADAPDVAEALLLLSYPLHPPGRRDVRTAHFPRLVTPTLFAHGSVDPFGSLEDVEAARRLIAGPNALVPVEGAGHGLGRGGRVSSPAAATIATIVASFLAFVDAEAKPDRG